MKIRDALASADRLQRSRWFKVIASVVVVALCVASFVTYVVTREARADQPARFDLPAVPEVPKDAVLTDAQKAELEQAKAARNAAETTAKSINDMLATRADPTAVGVGVGIAGLMALGMIWLGIGLTSLALILLLAGVCYPLYRLGLSLPATMSDFGATLVGASKFTAAVGVLALSFVVLMELLKAALSRADPISAIARNVVNEAVRMKVSLVFIVILLIGLAALPGLLDASTPLRYRVQSFMQYGTGGTFWVVAILVLFLAVGSVAFEQRDKVIWQTMTKPVASWQYLLGKWVGVVGVAAVLLAVSSAGVFLFNEYLRNQPALGETAPYVAKNGSISEDRLVLETQVLSARKSVGPMLPQIDAEAEKQEIDARLARVKAADPLYVETANTRADLKKSLDDERRTQFLTIESRNREIFSFTGLQTARDSGSPVTLRYRVDVGANDPRETYRITFILPNATPRVQEVPGGQTMTLPISPASISPEGELKVMVINGDVETGEAMDKSMMFPPDGIEVFYPAGSYRLNFLRVIAVLWLKLAFLAMVAVWAATYLSFSVASLVAFGTFLVAESAGYLANSLEYFSATDAKGNTEIWKVFIRLIAVPISWIFGGYGRLDPTGSLVEGRMVGWETVLQALLALGLFTAILYAIAVQIFRGRELATYSGQ